jgi:hypothetical protein
MLEEGLAMRVDVTCKKCSQRQRLDLGDPGATPVGEFLHLVTERLSHRPSFECFGGHLELAPPLPRYWILHWETLGE